MAISQDKIIRFQNNTLADKVVLSIVTDAEELKTINEVLELKNIPEKERKKHELRKLTLTIQINLLSSLITS